MTASLNEKLRTVKWGKYKTSELFKPQKITNMLSKEDLSDKSSFPAYSSESTNNGIIGYTDSPEFVCDDEHPVFVTFGDHTRSFNIATKSFSVLDNVKVLLPSIHNDLFECINSGNREHEFLARTIQNNTEQGGVLFTPLSELERFDDINGLIRKYNSLVYARKHAERYLCIYKDHLYMRGYVDDTTKIIKKLKELSSTGMSGYSDFIESWLSKNPSYRIDSKEKLNALKTIFSDSHVALIYGSAGTGKSTLINHISNLYNDRKKLYLANTNPAVDNMRRKVNAGNCDFKTIAKFLSDYNTNTECDILFIDECSTVSNKDMRDILEKATFKLLVLVGDVFQIEAILFGNWFSIARTFVPETSVSELSTAAPMKGCSPSGIELENFKTIFLNRWLKVNIL